MWGDVPHWASDRRGEPSYSVLVRVWAHDVHHDAHFFTAAAAWEIVCGVTEKLWGISLDLGDRRRLHP